MKQHITVEYTFAVTYIVEEDSYVEAVKKVKEHCGMVAGKVHSTLPDEEIDWEVDVHPCYKFVK